MKYKNSKGLVVLLYFSIVLFPVLSLASGYIAYVEYIAGEGEDIFMLCIGFTLFGFLSPFGFKLAKFVRLEYTLTDQGIEISNGKNSETHLWNKKMRVKDSRFLQLFWLYTSDNKAVVMVDYMMPGFEEFSEFIISKVQA